jgi:mannosyl-3-phosphoglycerate synthase
MILELPRKTEHLGAVRIHEVQRVYELDSGASKFPTKAKEAVATISSDEIERINQKMAIVVPIKDERLNLLEGVLSGIPHDCQVIVVSNSARSPVDRFQTEKQSIKEFNHFVDDKILLVHQQDPGVSKAFRDAGFDSVLESGTVRGGKAEGMLVATLLGKMLGKEYLGFIDADNYIPGAVHEYVEIFAAGFILAESPYSMVRVSWTHKPKIEDDRLFFPKWGRVSEVTNQCLNRLIESHTGFGTEIIKTGNAGEHALSMALADLLFYASGFAVETYEIVNILEQFGGLLPPTHPEVMSSGVDIFQIETRNPHLHEDKGEGHIDEMLLSSLGAIYNSPICSEKAKNNIASILAGRGLGKEGQEPPPPTKIEPAATLDLQRFAETIRRESQTLSEFGR